MRVKWAPGEVCNTGGDDYLVPFNENSSGSWFKAFSFKSRKAAPKKQEEKKEEIKKEEKKTDVVDLFFDTFKF